jgi:hypothetical protein
MAGPGSCLVTTTLADAEWARLERCCARNPRRGGPLGRSSAGAQRRVLTDPLRAALSGLTPGWSGPTSMLPVPGTHRPPISPRMVLTSTEVDAGGRVESRESHAAAQPGDTGPVPGRADEQDLKVRLRMVAQAMSAPVPDSAVKRLTLSRHREQRWGLLRACRLDTAVADTRIATHSPADAGLRRSRADR